MNPFLKTILFSLATVFLTFLLITFPEEALNASLRGLSMWAEIVFPSLLPFFIAAELLLAFGVVKFLGVIFEPIMRPLFNVPGAGSFGWMMGMASGYPTGAKIAARLREEKQLTQIEAERLVSFTNNSSPLFIFGAISVGLFQQASLGIFLALCHYIGNFFVGICMRFYKSSEETPKKEKKGSALLPLAFKEMHHTRMKDDRPLGDILGQAVLQSIQTLVMVGGFIILFSVVVELLQLVSISLIVSKAFELLFFVIGIPASLAIPFFSGLFEITLGATLIAGTETDTFLPKLILVSFILGFNGFSIQAQVASILSKTDIRFTPYLFSRILHGGIASVLTLLLYKPLYLDKLHTNATDVPVTADGTLSIFQYILLELQSVGPWITFIFIGIGFIILFRTKRIE